MKRILLWLLAAVGVLLAVVVAVGVVLYSRADVSTVGELRFANRLAIPPLLEPRVEGGRKVFELALRPGQAELLPGKPAETWGANGAYLGPTLRATRGDRVEIRVRNELPETTTIHWHGMHLPAAADGGPHQTIQPRSAWSPRWTVDQPAATLWYHPHPHGETADHVYRGIAGLFLVDDDASSLPSDYGVDDIPLIIQDKRLDGDGSLDFSQNFLSTTGRLGDRILVNGTYDPYVEVRHERVRLRLLNASDARVYDIGFADGRAFDLVGSDGGLLEAAQRLTRIQLSAGERAEVVASFRPGENVVLRSFEPDLRTNFFENRFDGGDDSFDLLQLRASRTLTSSREVPEQLTSLPPRQRAVRTRRFELDDNSINGKELDLARNDAVVEPGVTELWRVENSSGTPHSFHPHGVSFRVVRYAGGPPPPALLGLKDTVYVPPGETVELLVRTPTHAEGHVPYMFHCHVLRHEDSGMMGQFVVRAH